MESTKILFLLALLSSSSYLASSTDVTYDGRALIINGERRVLFSGSIHYPRSTPEMWPDLIQKAKEGGLDAIETYVFWNAHEPRHREYNFEGNLDLIRFLKTIQDAGMYAILRIGPYVCAEWNYGGLPMWLHQMPGVQLRTDNQIFKDEMQTFTSLIVDMLKQEKLLARQGGPIIVTQIENEYGNIDGPYGAAGKSYIDWCANMAESLDVGVPWIMCQQSDAPQPMINTCNGFYCDTFKPNNPNSPKMWTENWTGWFKGWGARDPHRPAEDVAYAVASFFQSGGTFQNYYMYHGGTNFGRTSGGPYVVTSYDYDAPIDEYGNLRQPKWGHLKQLHTSIKMMERVLTYGKVSITELGNGVSISKYSANGTKPGCFLRNENTTTDATVTFEGHQYFVPAWSVSISPYCNEEVYNTAKVNVQTSLMTKRPSDIEDGTANLNWSWRPDQIREILKGEKYEFAATQLLEKNMVTGDVSDYLWYTTSIHISEEDPIWSNQMTLRVNTTGHALHAFVNGKLIGSQYAENGKYSFVFEQSATMRPGKNYITLLSGTVGLANYGSYYDLVPTGIVGGPVTLIGNENITMDLSSNKWFYKIGLDGEAKQLYLEKASHSYKWHSDDLDTRRIMTWYKTTFKAPLGNDPVVVDMQGMGKGQAWVNGQSIGRYWPTFMAPDDGCTECDYRGSYGPSKCSNGCSQPSQRWYHVPRSFLNEDNNTLVLFEEVGGDTSQVNFQTVTIGSICGSAYEGNTLQLTCQGSRTISAIQFASFGHPQGTCGSFQKGSCDAQNTLSLVQQACIGQSSCSINVSDSVIGSSNCGRDFPRRLAIQALC